MKNSMMLEQFDVLTSDKRALTYSLLLHTEEWVDHVFEMAIDRPFRHMKQALMLLREN